MEHFLEEEALFAGACVGGGEDGCPVANGVEGSFEAYACKWLVIC